MRSRSTKSFLALLHPPLPLLPTMTPATPKKRSRSSKEDKIPRPSNAWLLFRNEHKNIVDPGRVMSQPEISKAVSILWRNADQEKYQRLADMAKIQHRRDYPDYKYKPKSREEKNRIKQEQMDKRKEERRLKKQEKKATMRTRRKTSPSASETMPETTMSQTLPGQEALGDNSNQWLESFQTTAVPVGLLIIFSLTIVLSLHIHSHPGVLPFSSTFPNFAFLQVPTIIGLLRE
jgi:hypothetical protein